MLKIFGKHRTATLLAITLLTSLAVGIVSPGYISVATLRTIVINSLTLSTIASGVMLVILTRSIDVSVGSTLGRSAAILGLGLQAGFGIEVAILMSLATGVLCGLFNGFLVCVLRVPAIIATLGTLGMFRGIMLIVTGGKWIEDLPDTIKQLASPVLYGFPILVVLVVAIAICLHLFLSRTKMGRFVYAVGDNAEAARNIGLPSQFIRINVFVASGLLAAVGGIIFAAQLGFIPSQAGNGIELRAIAATVLGGVSLLGGSGTIGGVIAAVLFLTSIDSALVFLHIPPYWNDVIAGGMLLVVLLLDGRLRLALERVNRARRYSNKHVEAHAPAQTSTVRRPI